MKSLIRIGIGVTCLLIALATMAAAQIVYTPVNVMIPVNGSYQVDLDRDGIADFEIRSSIGLVWCTGGDGGFWRLTSRAAQAGGGVVASAQNAVALSWGVAIDSTQAFSGGTSEMVHFSWGYCGRVIDGDWFNVANRYLGVRFQVRNHGVPETHYGWIKVSDVAYLDNHQNLQAATFVSGFAYETVPGQRIMAGETASAELAENPGTAQQ